MVHIIFDGTFAVFHRVIAGGGATGWFSHLWLWWGRNVDRRYITADPFLVSADAFQVLLRVERVSVNIAWKPV